MAGESIVIQGGATIEPCECPNGHGVTKRSRGGQDGRFTMQCSECGLRQFIYTFPNAPMLRFWRNECPEGTEFKEYANERITAHLAAHSPVAAPG